MSKKHQNDEMGLGSILYIALLLVNSVAVLSEERFLSRGEQLQSESCLARETKCFACAVGWSSQSSQQQQFAPANYVDPVYGQPHSADSAGVKVRLINLISAVRTLLRSQSTLTLYACCSMLRIFGLTVPLIAVNIIVIGYELVLG